MRNGLSLLVIAAASALATAQVVVPPGIALVGSYSATAFGGASAPSALDFSADGQTAWFGVNGNQQNSALFTAPVLRDPVTQRIVGFGQSSFAMLTPYIDAGTEIGPNGHRFFSEFPVTNLGEIVGNGVVHHPLPGVIGTTGGMTFIPAGFPNAGALLVSSFSGNQVFLVTTAPGPNGTLVPQSASVYCTLPVNLLEGIRFIPSGPYAGDLLVCDFNSPNGTLWRVDIDNATGLPVGGALASVCVPFITNLPAEDGLAFDPVTGDFLVTDWNGFQVTHFTGLDSLDTLVASDDTLSAAGQNLFFRMRCGSANAFKYYVLCLSASGSTPGVDVGALHVPLNPDALTYQALNMVAQYPFIAFENYLGFFGDAAAVLTLGPNLISPAAAGFTLTFCAVLVDAFDFATNPVDITIVP